MIFFAGTDIYIILQSIENELLERLKKGVYGDIYNYPFGKYEELLAKEGERAKISEDEEEEEEEVMHQLLCIGFIV